MDNYIQFKCKSCIQNEIILRNMVALFISDFNPTLDVITEVKTMLSEAVINAIIHGYENDDKGDIIVILELLNDTLKIKVIDHGCGIEDLKKAREPLYTTKPEQERSGMGITIMESLSDEFNIQSSLNEGTTIEMVKKLRGRQ